MRARINKRGFTLLEILVVIAMLGVVSGVIYTVWYTNWISSEDRISRASMWEEANIIIETLTADVRYSKDIIITGGNKIASINNSLGVLVATYTITAGGKFQLTKGGVTQDLSSHINVSRSSFTSQGRGLRLQLGLDYPLYNRILTIDTATEVFPRN